MRPTVRTNQEDKRQPMLRIATPKPDHAGRLLVTTRQPHAPGCLRAGTSPAQAVEDSPRTLWPHPLP